MNLRTWYYVEILTISTAQPSGAKTSKPANLKSCITRVISYPQASQIWIRWIAFHKTARTCQLLRSLTGNNSVKDCTEKKFWITKEDTLQIPKVRCDSLLTAGRGLQFPENRKKENTSYVFHAPSAHYQGLPTICRAAHTAALPSTTTLISIFRKQQSFCAKAYLSSELSIISSSSHLLDTEHYSHWKDTKLWQESWQGLSKVSCPLIKQLLITEQRTQQDQGQKCNFALLHLRVRVLNPRAPFPPLCDLYCTVFCFVVLLQWGVNPRFCAR